MFFQSRASLSVRNRRSSQIYPYKCVSGGVFALRGASQAPGARWDLPHWVGSAPLTSLSSLDKDGRNLPLCFSLLPFPSLLLSHSCIISLSLSSLLLLPFCLPESHSIFVLFSHPSPSLSLFDPLSYIVSLSSACGLISLVCCWCCLVTEPACHAWVGGLGWLTVTWRRAGLEGGGVWRIGVLKGKCCHPAIR